MDIVIIINENCYYYQWALLLLSMKIVIIINGHCY